MRIPTISGTVLNGCAVLALLTGCSGVASENVAVLRPAGHATHQLLAPSILPSGVHLHLASHPVVGDSYNTCGIPFPLLFLSDPTIPEIYIFKATENGNLFPCGAILRNGLVTPQGLDLDPNGNLWVANTLASNILEFQAPYTGAPIATAADNLQYPVGIEADCKGMWVTNSGTTTGGSGSVQQFNAGGVVGMPVSDPNAKTEFFPTCDPSHNLFTTYLDNNGVGRVNMFPFLPGPIAELGIALQYPGGIDYENNVLLVGDQTAKSIIPCPNGTTPCGPPILLKGAADPVTFDLNFTDDDLFTADALLPGFQEYDYPTGKLDKSLTFNEHKFIGAAIWLDDARPPMRH